MSEKRVAFEIIEKGQGVVFNVIFLDTGEIRQKRRSGEWLMRRVFRDELRTWKRRWGDEVVYEEEQSDD